MEEKVNRKRFLLSVATFLLFFGLMVFVSERTRETQEINSPNTPSCIDEPDVKGAELNISCSSNNACGTPAYGGCVWRNPCYSSEYQCPSIPGLCCGRGPCTDTCSPCVGDYQSSNNGCGTDLVSCAIYDCHSQCGTNSAQCYPKKYTLTYSAGAGGTITGTTPQSVCFNSYGTQVTAVPNGGYLFQKWSDNVMTASRTDLSTDNLTVTASFIVDNTNNPPTAPTSPFTNGATNPTGVNTLTPYFSAIFNDPDTGNTGVHYQIQVNTNSSFSGTVMWDSTKSAMSATAIGARSPNITYAGTTLSFNGTTYYWRIKFWDNKGADGPWSSTAQFTMNTAPTAPTSPFTNGATNPTGVITLTPYFSAIFNDPDTGNTGVHYQIQVNTNSSFSGTVMWDSTKSAMSATAIGVRSPNITYAGTTLSLNGTTYYWRIKFWDNKGADGPWSSTAQFTMNTAPTAPTSLLTNGATNPTDIPSNPYFSAIFNDADSGNTGVHYQIQVNTNSSYTGTMMWDTGKTSMSATSPGARSPNITYDGDTLDINQVTYYWRIRFWDNIGTTSPWSANAQFTTAPAPSVPTSLLTNGATNPTNVVPSPYFSAIFNHTNSSRRGVYYQIIMTESDGTAFWDSGKTAMTSTAPGSRSPNISYSGSAPLDHDGSTYKWKIYFWDDLGLISPISAEAQFTMNTRPTPPTGLLTEGLTNPVGITDYTPEFSAIYQDMSGKTAVYYQIQVNRLSNFTGTMVWDTDKTSMTAVSPGTRIPDKTYAGTTLIQGQTYYWRIKFWDNRGGDGEWSEINSFSMAASVTTYTVAGRGPQLPSLLISKSTNLTKMGGAYSFTKEFVGRIEIPTNINTITLNRSWITGNGSILLASLYYTNVGVGVACPADSDSYTLYRELANSNGLTFPLTFTAPTSSDCIVSRLSRCCVYVRFEFEPSTISPGSELDFLISNFTVSDNSTQRYGLPANISGTTLFTTQPTFTSISNTGPSNPGSTITFNADAGDDDGDDVKLVVCKTTGITGTHCDGGSSDTFCESSYSGSDPSCSWSVPSPYADGSYYAYPYIFDDDGLGSTSSPQGAAHSFGVNNVAPVPTSIKINNGDDITLVESDTKEVYIDITVQDNNGCANNEISDVVASLYRSGVGYSSCNGSAHSDPNNCYPEISCTYVTSSCNSNKAFYTCKAGLVHYADPTDDNSPQPSQSWVASAEATDNGLGSGGTNPLSSTYSMTSGPDVNCLLAFTITQTLSYGVALIGQATSLSPTTTITSAGNIPLNHLISGTNMCDDFPDCLGNTIPVSQQRYALSSGTDYEEATPIYSTPASTPTNLPKQTTSTPTSINIWWGILVPEGTAMTSYEGENTVTSSINYWWLNL